MLTRVVRVVLRTDRLSCGTLKSWAVLLSAIAVRALAFGIILWVDIVGVPVCLGRLSVKSLNPTRLLCSLRLCRDVVIVSTTGLGL